MFPNKSFGQLLDISPKILRTFNLEISYIAISFTDLNPSDLLKNAFCITSRGCALPCCTCWNIFQGSKKCMKRQWSATHTSWNLSLITSKHKKYEKKQCECIQVVKNLELPADCYFPCPQYSFSFLIILRHRRCVKKQLKKVHGDPWPLSDPGDVEWGNRYEAIHAG